MLFLKHVPVSRVRAAAVNAEASWRLLKQRMLQADLSTEQLATLDQQGKRLLSLLLDAHVHAVCMLMQRLILAMPHREVRLSSAARDAAEEIQHELVRLARGDITPTLPLARLATELVKLVPTTDSRATSGVCEADYFLPCMPSAMMTGGIKKAYVDAVSRYEGPMRDAMVAYNEERSAANKKALIAVFMALENRNLPDLAGWAHAMAHALLSGVPDVPDQGQMVLLMNVAASVKCNVAFQLDRRVLSRMAWQMTQLRSARAQFLARRYNLLELLDVGQSMVGRRVLPDTGAFGEGWQNVCDAWEEYANKPETGIERVQTSLARLREVCVMSSPLTQMVGDLTLLLQHLGRGHFAESRPAVVRLFSERMAILKDLMDGGDRAAIDAEAKVSADVVQQTITQRDVSVSIVNSVTLPIVSLAQEISREIDGYVATAASSGHDGNEAAVASLLESVNTLLLARGVPGVEVVLEGAHEVIRGLPGTMGHLTQVRQAVDLLGRTDAAAAEEVIKSVRARIASERAAAVASDVVRKSARRLMTDRPEDREMFEVFAPEAREVCESIIRVASSVSDEVIAAENANDLRRGFHTLKGSARIVGLQWLGEAAYLFEAEFNTCISAGMVPSVLAYAASEAARLYLSLVEEMAKSRDLSGQVDLDAFASILDKARQEPAAMPPEHAAPEEPAGFAATMPVGLEPPTPRAVETAVAPAPMPAVAPVAASPAAATTPEPVAPAVAAAGAAGESQVRALPAMPTAMVHLGDLPDRPDPELLAIFHREAGVMAELLRRELERLLSEADEADSGEVARAGLVRPELVRAAHSLCGLGRAIGCVALSRYAGALEAWAEHLQLAGQPATAEAALCALRVHMVIDAALGALRDDGVAPGHIAYVNAPVARLEKACGRALAVIAPLTTANAATAATPVASGVATATDPAQPTADVPAQAAPVASGDTAQGALEAQEVQALPTLPAVQEVSVGSDAAAHVDASRAGPPDEAAGVPQTPAIEHPAGGASAPTLAEAAAPLVIEAGPGQQTSPVPERDWQGAEDAEGAIDAASVLASIAATPPAPASTPAVAAGATALATAALTDGYGGGCEGFLVADGVIDDPDREMILVFAPEADGLFDLLDKACEGFDPGAPERFGEINRALHTFKGSARMCGLLRMGAMLHQMEDATAATETLTESDARALAATLQRAVDHLRGWFTQILDPDAAAGAAAAGSTAGGEVKAVVGTGGVVDEQQVVRVSNAALDSLAKLISGMRITIDGFVHQSEQAVRLSRDMDGPLERVVGMSRAIAQYVQQNTDSGAVQSAAADDAHDGSFDALEMDRYGLVHEHARRLEEAASDVGQIIEQLFMTLTALVASTRSQTRHAFAAQSSLDAMSRMSLTSIERRLRAIVRQASEESERSCLMQVQGDVQVERATMERVMPALDHILRNCVAHGIESREARHAAGKPEQGLITVSVRQDGTFAVISIADDGAGVNFERVLAKAVSKGLLAVTDTPTEAQLIEALFTPGFSTAEKVTGLAGRGVGLDVVRDTLRGLGGQVTLRSQAGKGTEFELRVPVTASRVAGVILRVAGHPYLVPSSLVKGVELVPGERVKSALETGLALKINEDEPPLQIHSMAKLCSLSADLTIQSFCPLLVIQSDSPAAVVADSIEFVSDVPMQQLGGLQLRGGVIALCALANGQVAPVLNMAEVLLFKAPAGVGQGEDGPAQIVAERGKPTVLVVDDSITVRTVTKRMLERNGYVVETAEDGSRAVDRMLSTDRALPDAILMDIEMPVMDGFSACRAVRAMQSAARHVPIAIISSRNADKHIATARDAGANTFFGKPYKDGDVLAWLAQQTSPHSHSAAPASQTAPAALELSAQ